MHGCQAADRYEKSQGFCENQHTFTAEPGRNPSGGKSACYHPQGLNDQKCGHLGGRQPEEILGIEINEGIDHGGSMGETIRYQKPVKIPAAEAAEKFTQVNLHIAFLFGTCSHRFFSERNKAQNRGSQKNTGKTEDNAVFCSAIQLRRIPDDFDEIAGYKGDETGYGKKCPCQLPPPSAGHTVPEQMIPDNAAHGLETKI